MKKLQNNFTTPEQSNRLLELGVPADSADCYYDSYDIAHPNLLCPYILFEGTYTDYFKYISCIRADVLCPCWSVGRLIEIYTIAIDADFVEFDVYANSPCVLKEMFDRIESDIDKLDFSKLEE